MSVGFTSSGHSGSAGLLASAWSVYASAASAGETLPDFSLQTQYMNTLFHTLTAIFAACFACSTRSCLLFFGLGIQGVRLQQQQQQ
eukprot:m.63108 g.63108  ORF g.63108 m.63108 type:complete len:86 (-) comp16336_c0_seq1:2-259(-)